MDMMKGKNPKQELSLIYFSSCPNYEPIKKMLQEIGLIFKEINQDNLQEEDFGKNFTSPTLIMNTDNIIFGGVTESSEGACSTELPNKKEIVNLMKAICAIVAVSLVPKTHSSSMQIVLSILWVQEPLA